MTAPATARPPRLPVPLPQESPYTLDVLGRPVLAFAVHGIPTSQGSHSVKGRRTKATKNGARSVPLVVDSMNEATKTRAAGALDRWRDAVAMAAIGALPPGWEALDEPLIADLIVSIPRWKSTPRARRTLPHTKPDLSKLARAAEDGVGTTAAAGLKGKGGHVIIPGRKIIADDSRIVAYRRLDKVWVGDSGDSDSLRRSGAIIRLWRYPAALLEDPRP